MKEPEKSACYWGIVIGGMAGILVMATLFKFMPSLMPSNPFVPSTSVSKIVGTVGATGRLQIEADGKCRVIALNNAIEFGVIDSKTVIAYRMKPGVMDDWVYVNLDALRDIFDKRTVTIIALVEYTRHATEVFRPIRVIKMEAFLHLDGMPKVVTE